MTPYNFDLFTTWKYVIRRIPQPFNFEEIYPIFAHKLILAQSPSARHNECKRSYHFLHFVDRASFNDSW